MHVLEAGFDRHGAGKGHGGNRCARDAFCDGDRPLPVAARPRTEGLQRRVRQDRVSGWTPGLRTRHQRALHGQCRERGGTSNLLRAHNRRAFPVHCRVERLGSLSAAGALENMQKSVCTRLLGIHFVDGAGHWVQQEQPAEVVRLLLRFLQQSARLTAGR